MTADAHRRAAQADAEEQADVARWDSLQRVWAPVLAELMKRDVARQQREQALVESGGGWRTAAQPRG